MSTNNKLNIMKILTLVLFALIIWTSISVYCYYTGPEAVVDTYIDQLAKKEYEEIYTLIDQEGLQKKYTKEQLVGYYKKVYEIDDNLVAVRRVGKATTKRAAESKESCLAFCNMNYIFSNKQQTDALYLIKKGPVWKLRFPFAESEVKVYAPLGSKVYINEKEIKDYKGEAYVESNVLPGKYLIHVEFPSRIYNNFYQNITVPQEKEIFLSYNMLDVEVKTIKNMIVELEGVQKESGEGIAVFSNMLEGNYKLKVLSKNAYIEPIEKNITVNKEARLFQILDVSLSDEGKEKLSNFMKEFYNSYLKDIREQQCVHILSYLSKESLPHYKDNFSAWFIENKKIKKTKILVRPSAIQIDESGFFLAIVQEVIELVNREFDKYENDYVNRTYKLILEWDTIIDIAKEDWTIIKREMRQSIVSYKDSDGKWVQY